MTKNMSDEWIVDCTVSPDVTSDLFAFCPLEKIDGEVQIVVGLTLVSDMPPGELVGFFHSDGQEAVEQWLKHNDEAVQLLSARINQRKSEEKNDSAG